MAPKRLNLTVYHVIDPKKEDPEIEFNTSKISNREFSQHKFTFATEIYNYAEAVRRG